MGIYIYNVIVDPELIINIGKSINRKENNLPTEPGDSRIGFI